MNGVWRTYFAEKPNCTVTYAQHECIICCCRSDGTIDVWASGSHAVVSRTVDHTVLSSNPPLPTGQTVLMQSSSTDLQSKTHNTVWVNSFVQCCFTSTETVPTIRDGEPRTPTSTFTQLLSSEQISRSSWYLFTQIDLRQGSIFCNRQKCSVLPRQNSPHSNYCFIKTAQSTLNLLCFTTTASTVHMQPTLFYQDSQHSPHSDYSI